MWWWVVGWCGGAVVLVKKYIRNRSTTFSDASGLLTCCSLLYRFLSDFSPSDFYIFIAQGCHLSDGCHLSGGGTTIELNDFLSSVFIAHPVPSLRWVMGDWVR